ncbi:phage tail tape measure protein, partial [Arenibacter sp. F26102]|uniref:phage tail tape measure protein n=1 Tax=Arenibacter sp. F26102 TaxID=2926416 RepID=UPI001FF64B13
NFSNNGIAAIKRFDHSINRTFSKLGNLTKLTLGIGLGTLFASGIGGVRDYETGLVGVSKTTGIIGRDLKQFSNEVLMTSKKLRGISSDKLLELAQVAGQLGVTGNANILKFSTTLSKLEKASDIQGEAGAASIARLLTITGEGVGVVDRFASALVGLGNTSAATESEILGVASEVARATAAYKLQSTQILGISTALKSLDVRPEAAGTAVGKVFRGIEDATIKGGKTLAAYAKVMGLTSKEAKNIFASDKTAAFTALIKGLNNINVQGGSVQQTLSGLGLDGETVSKGIIPLATNFNLLEEKLKLANSAFKQNIDLNNEFSAASKTVNTALDSVKNSFNNVLIGTATAGSGLSKVQNTLFFVADHMETVVAVGAGLIGTFGALKVLVYGSQAAFAAYNIVLGVHSALSATASIAIGQNAVALGAYKTIMAVTTAGTWLATTATTAFGVALNLGLWPILAIVAAIAAVIAIFYYWDDITAWFGKQWKTFTGMIGAVWDNLVKWFKNFSFTDFFKNIGQSLMKYILWPMKQLLTLLSNMPGKVGKMASIGLDKIGEMSGELDVNDSRKPLDGPEVRAEQSRQATRDAMVKGSIDLNIRDKGNNVESAKSNGPVAIPIRLTNTQGMN